MAVYTVQLPPRMASDAVKFIAVNCVRHYIRSFVAVLTHYLYCTWIILGFVVGSITVQLCRTMAVRADKPLLIMDISVRSRFLMSWHIAHKSRCLLRFVAWVTCIYGYLLSLVAMSHLGFISHMALFASCDMAVRTVPLCIIFIHVYAKRFCRMPHVFVHHPSTGVVKCSRKSLGNI
uniref:Uncharacterized protein n=1 Tax=Candidatus Methanophaga sp. ANME-1 ERB7 TaxID=2759913 RepID=A0A7G9Z4F5_9EURY|nr:hypothetical protein FBIBDDDO_00001 [Methanosarcinales archaeon ANME-1 ERB7]